MCTHTVSQANTINSMARQVFASGTRRAYNQRFFYLDRYFFTFFKLISLRVYAFSSIYTILFLDIIQYFKTLKINYSILRLRLSLMVWQIQTFLNWFSINVREIFGQMSSRHFLLPRSIHQLLSINAAIIIDIFFKM